MLDGGPGNDLLAGGHDNDVYRFGRGSGQDRVNDDGGVWSNQGGNDRIELGAGITTADIQVVQTSISDLELRITGTDDLVARMISDEGLAPQHSNRPTNRPAGSMKRGSRITRAPYLYRSLAATSISSWGWARHIPR